MDGGVLSVRREVRKKNTESSHPVENCLSISRGFLSALPRLLSSVTMCQIQGFSPRFAASERGTLLM
jgi:hypothetical protein